MLGVFLLFFILALETCLLSTLDLMPIAQQALAQRIQGYLLRDKVFLA